MRAAKVRLATRTIVNRPLNLLFPLECEKNFDDVPNKADQEPEGRNETDGIEINENDENVNQNIRRSTRRAAFEASDRIYGQNLNDLHFILVSGMS